MAIIEVKNLTKEYKQKKSAGSLKEIFMNILKPDFNKYTAVDKISFSVEEGESIGYIGPNGSGKSTTIKMLSGILSPTSGSIMVDGRIPKKERIKNSKHIGVVTGNRSILFWDVPIIESFRLFKELYEIPDHVYENNLREFTKILNLESILNIPERQLSLGQRMKCNITAAFLHNPKVVFLDEPTIGLDIESKRNIREFISKINRERKITFIITSHDFQDIEALCKRIILINKGKIILDDEIKNVKRRFDKKKKIEFNIRPKNNILNSKLSLDNVFFKYEGDSKLQAEYFTNLISPGEIVNCVSQYYEIDDMTITQRSIEDIISEILTSA